MESKDKKKSVFMPTAMHLELRQLQLDLAREGKDLTFAEIIEMGLNALRNEKKQA